MLLPPNFLCCKNKKGRQRQKTKAFKAETIKRLSPRSKYCYFSHSRTSRIRKFFLSANHGGRQYFSVFHAPPTLKSISPALVIEVRWKLHLHNGYYDSFKEKADDLYRKLSSFVKISNLNIIRFFTFTQKLLRIQINKPQKWQLTLQQSCSNFMNSFLKFERQISTYSNSWTRCLNLFN